MFKKKWFLALLILGLAGVAIYNIAFFAGRERGSGQSSPTTTQNASTLPQQHEPNLNIINGSVQQQAGISGEEPSRPALSIVEIARRARDPVDLQVGGALSESRPWPQRDPFRLTQQRINLPIAHVESTDPPVKAPPETTSLRPETHLKVSAILVEESRRFALVNGFPKKVGSSVGGWRIEAIEPNYVMFQTPDGERKVETLKGFADAKQIPDK